MHAQIVYTTFSSHPNELPLGRLQVWLKLLDRPVPRNGEARKQCRVPDVTDMQQETMVYKGDSHTIKGNAFTYVEQPLSKEFSHDSSG